jgi:hypothetical protein
MRLSPFPFPSPLPFPFSFPNLVPMPKELHWQINGFMNSKPDWLPAGFDDVQDFVLTLDWKQQYDIGLRLYQAVMYSRLPETGPDIIQRIGGM